MKKNKKKLLIPCFLVVLLCVSVMAASAKTVRFTLGTSNSNKDLGVVAMKRWNELLKEKSGGDLKMTIVAGGALGSGQQLLQQLATNEIQVNMGGPILVHQLMKPYQCLEAEYVFDSAEHGYKVWTGKIGQELSRELEKQYDISIVGVALRGARQLTANKPIKTPEDLQGVKVRVTNPLRTKIFAAYGALPGPLPYSELYGGLRQGVYDAQENPIAAIWGQKFYEVQKSINLTNHVESYYIISANKTFMDGLNEEQRKVFKDTLAETMTWLSEKVKADEEEMLKKMAASGIEIVKPDVEAFRKTALPIVKEFAEKNCRPGLLDDILAAK